MELGSEKHLLKTIIIAGRIGDRSKIRALAREVEGRIVTMDTPHWPREVAQHLNDLYGFHHSLLGCADEEAKAFMRQQLDSAPFDRYLRIAEGEEDVQENAHIEIEK